jgi:hypothetical protein
MLRAPRGPIVRVNTRVPIEISSFGRNRSAAGKHDAAPLHAFRDFVQEHDVHVS